MDTTEMLQALMENKKRYAKSLDEEGVFAYIDYLNSSDGLIVKKYEMPHKLHLMGKWEVIEPEKNLKQMRFDEAFSRMMKEKDKCWDDLRNASCGSSFSDPHMQKKIEELGLWTVEGIYEDEEE